MTSAPPPPPHYEFRPRRWLADLTVNAAHIAGSKWFERLSPRPHTIRVELGELADGRFVARVVVRWQATDLQVHHVASLAAEAVEGGYLAVARLLDLAPRVGASWPDAA